MSPLWHNRLCVYISPEHLGLLKLGRGLKPRLLATHDEPIATSGAQPPWRPVVGRLGELLAQPEWRNGEVEIVLSNRLVQYATITFNAQLKKYAEREGFARHVLSQTYGPVVGQWDLRIQKGGEAMPSLVSAVDRPLLDALRQSGADQKIKLRSMAPHLMAVFNKHRSAIKADPAWLVISEPGYSLFALLSQGEFAAINGVSHGGVEELPMLLDRENLICDFPEPCRTVYVHGFWKADVVPPGTGYEINGLEAAMPGGLPLSAGSYALALSGVL